MPPTGRPVVSAGGALGVSHSAADRASRERPRHRVDSAPEGHAAKLGGGQLGQDRQGQGAPRHLDPAVGTRGPGQEHPGRPRLAIALIEEPGTGSPHKCGWVGATWLGLRPEPSLPLRSRGRSQRKEHFRSSNQAASSDAAISPRPRCRGADRHPVVDLRFGTCRCHRVDDLADYSSLAGWGSGRRRSRRHHHGCRCATR